MDMITTEAVSLAGQGVPVFPCRMDKRPYTLSGFLDATTDTGAVEALFLRHEGRCMIGMPTGLLSKCFIVDLDLKPGIDGTESLRALEDRHGRLPETRTVLTPSGGTHLYFKHPGRGFKVKTNSGVIGLGIDIRGDGGYVIIPPSENYEYEASTTFAIAEAPQWLLDLVLDKGTNGTGKNGTSSAAVVDDHGDLSWLNTGAKVSKWVSSIIAGSPLHDSLRDLAAHLRAHGASEPAAINLLRGLMQQSAAKHTRQEDWEDRYRDIGRLVRSAGDFAPDKAEPENLTLWDAPVPLERRLQIAPAPITWFAENRLQAGRGVLVTGIGGSSKTRFLCQLAVGAVIGQLTWDWQIQRTGKAVLILTEDTPDDAHRTLWAICQGLQLSPAQIAAVEQNLLVYALAGTDMKLLGRDSFGGSLVKTPHFENLEQKIQTFGDVMFVGIDPALSITEGDENDQNDQRSLGKLIDDLAVRTGAAGALVSHAAKGSQQQEELTSHSSRGAGAITDAVRGEFVLRTMTASEAQTYGIADMEERKRHVQLAATKGNHLPPDAFVPLWLRRGDHGVLFEADMPEPVASTTHVADVREETADAAHAVLVELARTGTVRRRDWLAALELRGIVVGKPDATKRAMTRIVAALAVAGRIQKGMGHGVYLPVEGAEKWGQ